MTDIKVSTTSQLRLRPPSVEDAASIWRIVNESGVLDRNSSYLYLLMCRDFARTCLVAESDGEVVGFVIGYRPPDRPHVLFVWQIAVAPAAQGQGLGLRLLTDLVRRCNGDEFPEYVDATIAPSNTASRRLFQALATTFDTQLTEASGFAESDFPPGDHEAEPVIRIGPLSQASCMNPGAF
ncbi:diaminobutyrate acetyltransferase [Fuerstiella marisgermanici]|uniref:L-2,4-diaminobutyric acid acetyltransferase n=1 Tax=Fuerstiella marisgermanici TaxID=1891926 RepID=A0A1P8WN03_9PLAN|nr:diaminobutyrate acetyltransferase [Fuerstiella marisgermanici]APZ95444.1 L-2,4-diaminobutyric acid acetyltransferase [Fuerstiella marisgermanici]